MTALPPIPPDMEIPSPPRREPNEVMKRSSSTRMICFCPHMKDWVPDGIAVVKTDRAGAIHYLDDALLTRVFIEYLRDAFQGLADEHDREKGSDRSIELEPAREWRLAYRTFDYWHDEHVFELRHESEADQPDDIVIYEGQW